MRNWDWLGIQAFFACVIVIGVSFWCLTSGLAMLIGLPEIQAVPTALSTQKVDPAPTQESIAAVSSSEDEKIIEEAPNETSRLAKIGWEWFIGFVVVFGGIILFLISRGDITPRNFT